MSKNATFDGYDFAANGLTIVELDMYSRTTKTIQLEALAGEDGLVQVSKGRYSGKPIKVGGTLVAGDEAQMETAIDAFITAMNGEERVLDIPHAGSTRRFIATAQAPIITRASGAADVVGFSVEFIAPSGYGSDLSETTLLSQTITTAQSSILITVGGSYKAQPDITINITSVTGGNPNKAIRITNPDTTEGITITRNWAAGDVVVLNSRNRKIYINNNQVYAQGAFPSWEPGTQTFSYSDDFTTRSVDVLATYTRRWS